MPRPNRIDAPTIPINALFDEHCGPNPEVDHRATLATVDLIFGIDVMTRNEFLLLGRDKLERVVRSGRPEPLRVIKIELDQQTSELSALVEAILQAMGQTAPAVIPGAVYTRQQIERNLSTSSKTVTWWLDNGLRAFKPATKSQLFLGDDLIEFFKANPNLKTPPDYKTKLAQRHQSRGT